MQNRQKLFVGPKVRRLREASGWRLEPCAARLGVSTSYLSQIEANQRPVTARVLISLMQVFNVDAAHLDADDDQRLVADLREATADALGDGAPVGLAELNQAAIVTPNLARRYLDLHRAYARLDERLKVAEQAMALDEAVAASALLPYEEVRDFFHYKNNYLHDLDLASEGLAERIGLVQAASLDDLLVARLADQHGITVAFERGGDLLRGFDPTARRLTLNTAQPATTRTFQLASQIVALELADLIEQELAAANLRSPAAVDICRISLTNYAAGALLMPYEAFRAAAQAARHDLDRLASDFQVSLEQICHRLSTMQRPGARGVPFYFVRVDQAGNITKRHSATRFQFARFGGACALWNVHEAFSYEGRTLAQVAEMPDGVRYLSLARSIVKPGGAHGVTDRRYALGLGCELQYADAVVYADALNLSGAASPIGVSCRICERDACVQRAFPPVDRPIAVSRLERRIVPFRLAPN